MPRHAVRKLPPGFNWTCNLTWFLASQISAVRIGWRPLIIRGMLHKTLPGSPCTSGWKFIPFACRQLCYWSSLLELLYTPAHVGSTAKAWNWSVVRSESWITKWVVGSGQTNQKQSWLLCATPVEELVWWVVPHKQACTADALKVVVWTTPRCEGGETKLRSFLGRFYLIFYGVSLWITSSGAGSGATLI